MAADPSVLALDAIVASMEPEAEGGSSREKGGRLGRIVAVILLALVSMLVVPAGVFAVHARRGHQCKDHLKRLGEALHAYQAEHGHFPAPYTKDAAGRPLLSWRVTLLPYLHRRDLFERFHHDEPWNSPHNLPLLDEIPATLICPELGGGQTPYQVIVGPKTDLGSINTPFEEGRGVDIREITDGVSNVILVAEAARPIPWTCPEDLDFGQGHPLPKLGSRHERGPSIVMADGGARSLPSAILPEVFRALLTINGGELINGGDG